MLEEAWRGGAAACGRRVGAIASGYRGDIVVLDPSHPTLTGREDDDALDSWVFSGDDSPVRDVFTGGHQVVKEGRHVHAEAVAAHYRSAAADLSDHTAQLTIDFE